MKMHSDHLPAATASWADVLASMDERNQLSGQLSPAESAVALHVRRGSSNREIARLLKKSEATVKRQVHACLRKLGAKNRIQLIALLR